MCLILAFLPECDGTRAQGARTTRPHCISTVMAAHTAANTRALHSNHHCPHCDQDDQDDQDDEGVRATTGSTPQRWLIF